ncbi:MAG: NfeD family protein [Vulcanimicrobiota bacterium]
MTAFHFTIFFFGLFHGEREEESKGYSSVKKHLELEGHIGQAETDLRPSGYATIDGERYEVFSQGNFIYKGDTIRVLKVKDGKIQVTKV